MALLMKQNAKQTHLVRSSAFTESYAALIFTALCLMMLTNTCQAVLDETNFSLGEKSYGAAPEEIRPLADRGVAVAQYNLGLMYANGQGVPQDYEEAFKWTRLAADQGHAMAQINLGLIYANGLGVPQSFKEAFKWTQLAANQGNTSAQCHLGDAYAKGLGIPQNYRKALQWYRLAADSGDAEGQYRLGAMYHDGLGVPKDHIIAHALYSLSAINDSPSRDAAIEDSNWLASLMSRKELDTSKDLTRKLAEPGNLLKALDKHANGLAVRKSRATGRPREGHHSE